MTVPYNWIFNAAAEINESTGDLNNTETADIIAKHCPFKPDVDYMPVPRCETCAHWRPDSELTGGCMRVTIQGKVGIFYFSTTANFGCVDWKEK